MLNSNHKIMYLITIIIAFFYNYVSNDLLCNTVKNYLGKIIEDLKIRKITAPLCVNLLSSVILYNFRMRIHVRLFSILHVVIINPTFWMSEFRRL